MDEQEIRSRVSAMMPEILADLERLVAIPSVAFPGYPAGARAPDGRARPSRCSRASGSRTRPSWRCRPATRRSTARSPGRRARPS